MKMQPNQTGGKMGGANAPMTAQAVPQAGPYTGQNVMQQSANSLTQGFNAADQAIGANQQFLNNPNMGMYNAATGQSAQQNAPQSINNAMQQYTNPYQQQVIQRTTDEMMRQNAMAQDVNAANAINAGAFGGARHGLVEAQTNAATNRQVADMASSMNRQGYMDQAGLGAQDINNSINVGSMNQQAANQTNLANLGFMNQANQANAGQQQRNLQSYIDNQFGAGSSLANMGQNAYNIGNNINQNQMQAGGMSQALMQQILGAGEGMYGQYVNQPTQSLNTYLASLGMNPMNNTGTTTTTKDQGWGEALWGLAGAGLGAMSFNPISLPFGRG